MQRKAFVTGGTGFIGINLIRMLLQNGWNVTALHRSTSDLTYLSSLPVQLVEGSIVDKCSLTGVIPIHADAVFHLAGDTNLWSKKNHSQTKVNVQGTKNMLQSAAEARVKSFIYTSSASVWGEMTGKNISEDQPQKGKDSWVNYERTKWAGEQEVLKYSDSEMKVVILNPTAVTGPFDINNWGKLFVALKNKELPGIPDGVVSVTHVHEVCKAHIRAVDQGISGHNYILSGEDCSFKRFITEIARVSGANQIPKKVPDTLLKSIAYIQTSISHITGEHPTLTPELIKIMTRKKVTYSSQKAKAELGYDIIPMKRSVGDCYKWMCSEGYL